MQSPWELLAIYVTVFYGTMSVGIALWAEIAGLLLSHFVYCVME
jgi:hypothetical protein